MRKKDILELKKRLKKNDCTFTRLCGCYVNGEKHIILNIDENFLNLEEDEFFKYLEIAKKVLSGTIGNNLLELNFPVDGENIGGRQPFLMELKKSKLKDPELLNEFYQSIIDNFDYEGNFLILVFHDAYDIITKTSDNGKLDESEEVYEYLLCAVCPVSLSKPGLGYLEDENKIGARNRDWVVEAPAIGFTFPAFSYRSSDIYSTMYYTKNPKDSHPEFMEAGLGCISKQTAAEQKETFNNIVLNAIELADGKPEHLFMEIQENLNNIIDEKEAFNPDSEEPIILSTNTIQDVLSESGIPAEISSRIEKSYTEEFGDTPPAVEHLLDKKVLAANEQRKKEERLVQKVETLEQILEEKKQEAKLASESQSDDSLLDEAAYDSEDTALPNYDVVLRVKPEKMNEIKSEIIDGKKCIIIPMNEDEHANINGNKNIL